MQFLGKFERVDLPEISYQFDWKEEREGSKSLFGRVFEPDNRYPLILKTL